MWCFQKGLETGFIKCIPRVYGGDPYLWIAIPDEKSTPRVYGGDPNWWTDKYKL